MSDSSIVKDLLTDTWGKASWEEFLAYAEDDTYEYGRFYYDRGELRIEMAPIGSGHGQDNGTVYNVVIFFATLKQIRIKGFVNTSLRNVGIAEAQPDISFI